MSKNISVCSAIVISGIVFQIGYYVGSRFTTALYKKCVKWVTKGDDTEQMFGDLILHNHLGIRLASRVDEK
nr:MAG TPA: hypothetical protein [Caudoviricetes sp.]